MLVCEFLVLVSILCNTEAWTDYKIRKFSEDFMFGVATSAYQVEGAQDIDGRGPSIWDQYNTDQNQNGSVAADSYNLFKRDVEMLRELGVDHYRFSISWSRVMPEGFPNKINEAALQYYENLISELQKYNIEPVITMYHFDLPSRLQEFGGWLNPESVTWFEDYARVLLDRFGRNVKYWITVNQPNSICVEGYGLGTMAPFLKIDGIADYLCVKNVLLAHAKVWKMFKEYRKVGDRMGIALAVNWLDPVNNSTINVQATEENRDFTIGLYMDPIFSKTGNFPKSVRDIVDKKSKEQGFPRSRLPVLSQEEIETIRGSADYVAMNFYTTNLVKRDDKQKYPVPSFRDDTNVTLLFKKQWKKSQSEWLRSAPYGLYKAILYLNKKYDYPSILVAENGWSTDKGLKDQDRIEQLYECLVALALGIEDGGAVWGYTAWSLMDNFEWTAGFTERFGLYEVDFDSANKTRKARQSALVYKNMIENRIVDRSFEPTSLDISISDRRLKKRQKREEL